MPEPHDLELVEAINRALAHRFGGDHCFAINQLMRVPGTVNHPTPVKLKRGRTPALATILQEDTGRTVTLEEMAASFPPIRNGSGERAKVEADGYRLETADTLGLAPFSDIRNQIEEPLGQDRSSDAYWLAIMMLRDGFSDAHVIGVLLNPANPVAEHCVENDQPMRAATRALSAAKRNLPKDGGGEAGSRGAGSRANGSPGGAPAPRSGAGGPDQAELLDLLDAGTLAGIVPPPLGWVIHETIPPKQTTLFTAVGGGGKSRTALQMAAAVSIGARFWGLATRQGVAIYLTCEDDNDENLRRLIPIARATGLPLEAFKGKLFIKSLIERRDKGLARIDQNNKMTVLDLFWSVRATVLAKGARLLVLDNVAHLFEGNENIRAHVAAFIGLLNSLALEADCAIILVAHPNKAGDSFSGSTAWQNQVRSHVHLDTDADDPDRRHFRRAKANYAPIGEPIVVRWHGGVFRREDEIPPEENTRFTVLEARENERFLACLDARNQQQRPVSIHTQARESYAPRAFADMDEGEGLTERQALAAMNRLLDRGVIAQRELDYEKPGSRGHRAVGLTRIEQTGEDYEPPM